MSSRSSGSSRSSEADWLCPDAKCGNLNFARRTHCNRCGKAAQGPSASEKRKLLGTEIGKAAAEKSHGLFSADDWQCNKCGNVNWARRGTCNLCNAPKVGEVEERTGYGGGFNERTGVEYVQRDDSDDEFDEFGRRKKKFRGAEKAKSPPRPAARSPARDERKDEDEDDDDDDEDDDDDDEEGGDLSKYALWSDEENSKDDKQQSGGNKGVNGSAGRPRSASDRSSNSGRNRRSSSSDSERSRSRDRHQSGSSRSYSRDKDRSRSRDRPRKSPSSSRRRSRSRSGSRGRRERRRSDYSRSRSRSPTRRSRRN